MATAQPIDQAKQEAFVNKVLGDTSATMTTILASIGDRLGLFKDLAANGSATSAEVASRTGTNERYVREWLGGMAAAGYVEYDPTTSRFTVPGGTRSGDCYRGRSVFLRRDPSNAPRAGGGRRPGD